MGEPEPLTELERFQNSPDPAGTIAGLYERNERLRSQLNMSLYYAIAVLIICSVIFTCIGFCAGHSQGIKDSADMISIWVEERK